MKADGIQAIVGGALASEANDLFKPVLEFIKNEFNTIAVSASAEKAKLDEISKGGRFRYRQSREMHRVRRKCE
jgi:hypothetical protein